MSGPICTSPESPCPFSRHRSCCSWGEGAVFGDSWGRLERRNTWLSQRLPQPLAPVPRPNALCCVGLVSGGGRGGSLAGCQVHFSSQLARASVYVRQGATSQWSKAARALTMVYVTSVIGVAEGCACRGAAAGCAGARALLHSPAEQQRTPQRGQRQLQRRGWTGLSPQGAVIRSSPRRLCGLGPA